MVKLKDIEKRWNERIVPNGWDKMGSEGAELYMEKYGRGMGNDKKLAFVDYARSIDCNEFADYIEGTLD